MVVCPNCRSVVARGDRKLEDLGRVAALVDAGSPLEVGRKGKYGGAPFELTGRAQFAHEAGGVWDEWYASFPGDRWGWLAEAQGRFYLTFEKHLAADAKLPEPDKIELGHRFTIPGVGVLVASEIGRAMAQSAEGEIPYRLVPGAPLEYIDLSGPGGKFATFDYSDAETAVYLGEEVTLDDLGISPAAATEREPRHVGALQINCPQCGGALELKAPDVAERVACPYCNSLLDCAQGKLQYLETLSPGKFKPTIPLGTTGMLGGKPYTVIGFLVRHTTYLHTNYYWNEYLLYGVGTRFRWLVESDHHWSFVAAVPPGDAEVQSRIATYNGRHFRLFEKSTAIVDYVSGEFYWKVHVGERVALDDFIAPPEILSRETTLPEGATAVDAADARLRAKGEINWSLGTYLEPAEVAAAFKLPPLRASIGVGANQPFHSKGVYRIWGVLVTAAVVLWIVLSILMPSHRLLEKTFSLDPPAAPETARTVFESPIVLDAHRSLRFDISAPVDNSWLYVDGDLFNDETGLVQPFSVEVGYYHGVDSDGSWTEGSRSNGAFVSALPPGNYTLRLETQWQYATRPIQMSVRLEESGPRILYLLIVVLALSIVPIAVAIRQFNFEKQRWENSNY
ncbi:MAG TPA: DUF4178 domain-containing protein [Pirellulales bacterium]|nr:DUF4178 domain-containing protein [Pirellulales bacterium]